MVFLSQEPRRSQRFGRIGARKHGTCVRTAARVLCLFLLAILPPLRAPNCLAAMSADQSDGTAISRADSAAEARPTAPTDAASRVAGAIDGSSAEEGNARPAVSASDSPLVVKDPPSGLLQGDHTRPVLSGRCMLFNDGLCRATRDKRVVGFAAVQTAALISDGVTTRQYLRRGYTEVDPIAKVFLGSKPTWARMAPLGAVQVVAGMWLAERMATSRHVWVRRFWWLPQVAGIAGNSAATAHNVALR